MTSTRAFDTDAAGSSFATGFVVDSRRGLILTNRHVVKPGPTTVDAVFLNREETPCRPLYRDPVHDFGFLRFDPAKLEFMALGEVPLRPEGAQVGVEVRVVGNDSGEKVSILAGTLARLDRDAPVYSTKGYNDFNTFYIQAASGTKGGSSGSPVVNKDGAAVALNAGAKTKSQSAFFLPLARVVRALELCQRGWGGAPGAWEAPVVPRGDLQATFRFQGFDEVRRLGLSKSTESRVRAEEGEECHGMLTVESAVPGGPAEGCLEPGDVLVEVNGRIVVHFAALEEELDARVGEGVEITIERGGAQRRDTVQVQDLHAVSPSRFIEVAGGSVHALSYQQARNMRRRCGEVYVADPGYMLANAGVPKHAIVLSAGGAPVKSLDDYARSLSGLRQGEKLRLEYITFAERHRKRIALLQMDRRWYGPPVIWTRDDAKGIWHPDTQAAAEDCTKAADAAEPPAGAAAGAEVNGARGPPGDAASPPPSDLGEVLRPSLAAIDVEIPSVGLIDGVPSKSFYGNAVVVHHSDKVGLLLTDRNTVTIGTGDITIQFGAFPAELPGTVRFLHPTHNVAIISYDPAALCPEARAAIRPAQLRAQPPLQRGDRLDLVGLTKSQRVTARAVAVADPAVPLDIPIADVPRFRAINEESIELDQEIGTAFSGVLSDAEGGIRALWASYSRQASGEERQFCGGLSADVFSPWVSSIAQFSESVAGGGDASGPGDDSEVIPVPLLGVELGGVMLSKATNHGLPQEWVSRLAAHDPQRRQVLMVKGCLAGGLAGQSLQEGDLVLSVAGDLVSSFTSVEALVAAHFAEHGSGLNFGAGIDQEKLDALQPLDVKIVRDKAVVDVQVKLDVDDGFGTKRVVHFAGAQLQAPHRSIRELGFLPNETSGVFISRWHHGSPAHRYGLYALHFVKAVNGTPTPDLDAFLEATAAVPDGSFLRLSMCHLDGKPKIITLRLDLRYWPTWELRVDGRTGEWRRSVLRGAEP